jgi:hypothetical protein
VLVLLGVAVDLAADRLSPRQATALAVVTIVVVGGNFTAVAVANSVRGYPTAVSYNAPPWRSESTRELLAAVPRGGEVISNDPYAVYFLTLSPAHESPRASGAVPAAFAEGDLVRLRALVNSESAYLVWVTAEGAGAGHVSPEILARDFGLREIARASTGTVYEFAGGGR